MLLCFINDTNGTNYENFTESCLNNITKPNPSYIVPVEGEDIGAVNDNKTLWVLVSVANGDNQDKNLDLLKNASKFN